MSRGSRLKTPTPKQVRTAARHVLTDRGKHGLAQRRKDGQNLPAHIKDALDAFMITTSSTRAELEALRATRGSRSVGTVTIPAHLRGGGEILSDSYRDDSGRLVTPERRAMAAPILPAKD